MEVQSGYLLFSVLKETFHNKSMKQNIFKRLQNIFVDLCWRCNNFEEAFSKKDDHSSQPKIYKDNF